MELPERSRTGTSTSRCSSDTVVFNVGGKHFEILKYKVQAQPTTMLANLLDDIGTDDGVPIFVDACPKRFGHILDWYRYGEMFVPQHCSLDAVLRDALFFMLPEHVRINGSMHIVSAPSQMPAYRAESSHAKLKADVVSSWPSFNTYVDQLANEAFQLVVNLGSNSHEDAPLQGYERSQWLYDSPLNPDLQTEWHTVQVAKRGTVMHNPVCEWIDKDNVCNTSRMKVLILELRTRGFECAVDHSNWAIALRVRVPPSKGNTIQDVRIHGVDVVPSGNGRAYTNAIAVTQR